MIHNGEKPYECDVCKKRFSEKRRLKSHESTHTLKKPYECYICNRKFTNQTCFLKHTTTHTGRGDQFCKCELLDKKLKNTNDECMKQYSDHYSLKQHKLKDHGILYKCDFCHEIEASEPTGIGYLCCVCDAEFEVASKLEEHMLSHDN